MVARTDSMKLMSEGMFPVPWMHARMRSFSSVSVSGGGFGFLRRWMRELAEREGLYIAATAGVVMKVVKRAMSTRIVNISSLRTCLTMVVHCI